MKKIIGFIVTLLAVNFTYAQEDAISRFFDKYMDDDRFTSIYISGKMFNMFAQIPVDEKEEEVKKAISDLNGLRILTSDQVNGQSMYKEAARTLSLKGYEELMFIKEGGEEELQFLVKEADGKINELLMLIGNQDDFFLMSLVGNIDLNQIAKLAKTMDIEGMENLEKLKEKKTE